MKKIILMLLLLATTAYGYRLHVSYSMGGGLTATGVRTIITYGNGNTVATAKDSTITTTISATTSPIEKNWYLPDSLVSYNVTKIYYCPPDSFIEITENILPFEFPQYQRGQLAAANSGISVVLDSLDDQVWATAGTVTLSQADIDSIVAGVIAGTIGSNGTGIFAVTLYARDTINNAFVPGINLTAVSGATNLFATTGSTGAATFNVDAATWTFNALGSPYTWVPFSRSVSGSITDTITGGGVTIIPVTSPDLATIYGQVNRNGLPVSGLAVSIVLTRPDTLAIDSMFVDFNHTVYTDANGVWEDDVYFLAGSTRNFYYTVTFTVAGQKRVLYCRPTAQGGPYLINDILVEKP